MNTRVFREQLVFHRVPNDILNLIILCCYDKCQKPMIEGYYINLPVVKSRTAQREAYIESENLKLTCMTSVFLRDEYIDIKK